MRASGADDKARIVPPVVFSLEEALNNIKEDDMLKLPPPHTSRKFILETKSSANAQTVNPLQAVMEAFSLNIRGKTSTLRASCCHGNRQVKPTLSTPIQDIRDEENRDTR